MQEEKALNKEKWREIRKKLRKEAKDLQNQNPKESYTRITAVWEKYEDKILKL
jgi:hypothetical protein